MRYIINILLCCFLIVTSFSAFGQVAKDVVIQGSVTDSKTGETLIAVNVIEMDANGRIVNATISDFNGHYVIKVKDTSNKLTFTFIGFKSFETVPGSSKIINVELEENVETLEEHVVSAEKMHSEGAFAIPQREISTAIQTISTEEFEGLQVTSIDDALQGRIAGLDIVANSGDLGSGTAMRIRGASSINGNKDPLIVLNGIPWSQEIDESFDFANANEEEYANMLSINPEDILEISVLKDAASTAIWGSKGGSGVLMIKTKKGASGPTKVNYSHRFSRAVQPKGLNMLNGDGYTMLMKQSYFNPEQDENKADIDAFNYNRDYSEYENFNNNTDWFEEVTKVGYTSDHFVAISGGGKRAKYRVSGGYLSQTGTIIEQKLDRFSSRAYLDYSVSDRLKFIYEMAVTYTDNKKNYTWKENNHWVSLLELAYKKMPNVSVYEQDIYGNNTNAFYNIASDIEGISSDQVNLRNPVALAYLAKYNQKTYRITPTFRLQYDLTDPEKQMLRYNAYVSIDLNNDKLDTFLPQAATNATYGWSSADASGSHNDEKISVYTDNNITWKPRFTNLDHVFQLYGSFQIKTGNRAFRESYSRGYARETDSSASGYFPETANANISSWRSLGMLGRVHYSYKGKYIFSGTWRTDGSTKFGEDKKFGHFPGVSLKWIVSEEPFMKSTQNWLSTFAFRPGWGKSGKQPDSEYLHFSRYGAYGSYMGQNAIVPVSQRLSTLQWEESSEYNAGLDVGFFDDRYVFDLNVYNKRTSNLLQKDLSIPSSSGADKFAWQNVGTMDNFGWELNFYTDRGIKIKDKFTIDFNFNLSNNVNTVVEMDQRVLDAFNGDYDYKNGTYLSRFQVNNSFGSIYGFKYKGVYQFDKYIEGVQENAPVARDAKGNVIVDSNGVPLPMTFAYGKSSEYEFKGGDAIYEDINHDGTIDELDIVYLGNSNPKVSGGFGSTVRYKNFSCTAFFNFRYGNKIVNKARLNAESMLGSDNQSVAVNWRWRKNGDVTPIPRALYQSGYNSLGSDRYVEDGSFVRFKNLRFNYSLPLKTAKKLSLNKLSFFLTINNLYVFTKYTGVDPEVGYTSWGVSEDNGRTPRSKSFTLGVSVGL